MIQAESVITFWKLSANLDLAFRLWIQRICTQDNPELLHEPYCSFLFPELINEKCDNILKTFSQSWFSLQASHNPELSHESYCSFLFLELINEKFVKVLLYHSNWTYLYQIKQRG